MVTISVHMDERGGWTVQRYIAFADASGCRRHNKSKWSKNVDKRPHRRGSGLFTRKSECDTGQSGTMQSAAAVVLTPLLMQLIHTIQQ